jgi:hypothetical protein
MTELLLAYEPQVRLGLFLAVLVAMVGWELAAPPARDPAPDPVD